MLPEEMQATATINIHRKYDEAQPSGFREMQANRQTNEHSHHNSNKICRVMLNITSRSVLVGIYWKKTQNVS